jgi:hypothetical protein
MEAAIPAAPMSEPTDDITFLPIPPERRVVVYSGETKHTFDIRTLAAMFLKDSDARNPFTGAPFPPHIIERVQNYNNSPHPFRMEIKSMYFNEPTRTVDFPDSRAPLGDVVLDLYRRTYGALEDAIARGVQPSFVYVRSADKMFNVLKQEDFSVSFERAFMHAISPEGLVSATVKHSYLPDAHYRVLDVAYPALYRYALAKRYLFLSRVIPIEYRQLEPPRPDAPDNDQARLHELRTMIQSLQELTWPKLSDTLAFFIRKLRHMRLSADQARELEREIPERAPNGYWFAHLLFWRVVDKHLLEPRSVEGYYIRSRYSPSDYTLQEPHLREIQLSVCQERY